MKVKKWLTISSKGAARITQSHPRTGENEISIMLEVNLPDELFRKPRLEAKIDIPKEACTPDVLNSNVIENVKEAIEQSTGLQFSINVVKEEVEKEGPK